MHPDTNSRMQLSCMEGVWKLRFKGVSSQVGDRSSDRTVRQAGHATPTGGILGAPIFNLCRDCSLSTFPAFTESLGSQPRTLFSGPTPGNLGPSSLPGPEKGPTGASSELQRGPTQGPCWSKVNELDVRHTKGGCCSQGAHQIPKGLVPQR